MPLSDWTDAAIQIVTIVLTLIGCSFWVGGKLSAISQQLKDLTNWRIEVTADNKSIRTRLDEHGNRLDQHGVALARHGVEIDGIKERCRDSHGHGS